MFLTMCIGSQYCMSSPSTSLLAVRNKLDRFRTDHPCDTVIYYLIIGDLDHHLMFHPLSYQLQSLCTVFVCVLFADNRSPFIK